MLQKIEEKSVRFRANPWQKIKCPNFRSMVAEMTSPEFENP
jgi:hypothetical protein